MSEQAQVGDTVRLTIIVEGEVVDNYGLNVQGYTLQLGPNRTIEILSRATPPEGQWAWGTIAWEGSLHRGERVLLKWVRNGWASIEDTNRWASSQISDIVLVEKPLDRQLVLK